MALGVVMDANGISSDEAFRLLGHLGAELGVSLSVVVEKVNFLAALRGGLASWT